MYMQFSVSPFGLFMHIPHELIESSYSKCRATPIDICKIIWYFFIPEISPEFIFVRVYKRTTSSPFVHVNKYELRTLKILNGCNFPTRGSWHKCERLSIHKIGISSCLFSQAISISLLSGCRSVCLQPYLYTGAHIKQWADTHESWNETVAGHGYYLHHGI